MTPQKSGKGSPSRQEPTNIYPYPDWAAMQAYYGPGVPLPPPYLSSPMMPSHPPPQMWGPAQGVMQPFGAPYQAVYPPGVVYAHPPMPLAAIPPTTEQQPKRPDTTDRGKTKKLKIISLPKPATNGGDKGDDEDSSWSQDQGFDAAFDFSDSKGKDDRLSKREKRKQANRESARRSRMKKQAEVEELMEKYDALKMENNDLNFEINRLREESRKLRVENAALKKKLGVNEDTGPEEMGYDKLETGIAQTTRFRDELLAANSIAFSSEDGSENEALQNPNETNLLTFEPSEDDIA